MYSNLKELECLIIFQMRHHQEVRLLMTLMLPLRCPHLHQCQDRLHNQELALRLITQRTIIPMILDLLTLMRIH